MYNILIVDDEPFICKGLSSLLAGSGLDIGHVFTAHSGYEALDYLRMEDIDLLVTDIQMGAMSGIELMHQAKILKPWVETIIISAHETFQYAQMAIRLGAKDYLVKPLKSEQFLDSVRSVLLHLTKRQTTEADWGSGFDEHFRMDEPLQEQTELLNRLLVEPFTEEIGDAVAAAGVPLPGPYYAVIRIQLLDDVDGKRAAKDTRLLQYAALNIVSEVLDGQWNSVNFYTGGTDISAILQWSEEQYADAAVNKIDQLDMLGRSLHHNIRKYLSTPCVVGISQILKGPPFISLLNQQACKAIGWHGEHRDHYVFYYGDFKWNFSQEEPTPDEVSAQHNLIVDKAEEYILGNYARKGLTLHEVAQNNHVSPNYLSYLFKKNMGINLWEYVIKLRMEESKRLLQQTDMRRYEVAERVGYESPEHFSKIFKKYYGISPSELKK